MAVKTDIQIAREAKKFNIQEIGKKLGIDEISLVPYGHDKAKVSAEFIKQQADKSNGKLSPVTAINTTPAGEGKTTTTVGLGDGLNAIGKKIMVSGLPKVPSAEVIRLDSEGQIEGLF